MDEDNFAGPMKDRSDEELYEIVHFGNQDGFVPKAVQAAKEEFGLRTIDTERTAQLAKSVETKRKQQKLLA